MLTLLAAAFVALASAVPPARPIDTDAEAWSADAAQYAERHHVPLEEARRRLHLQEASVPVGDRLRQVYGDRLAGLFIEHDPDWRIVVLLTGDVPVPATIVPVGDAMVPILFRTGAPATRAALLAAFPQAQAALRAALPHPPGVGIDPRSGRLVVIVRARDVEGDAATTASRLSALIGLPIELRTWADVDRNLAVEGGGRLIGTEPADGRRYLCTAGFAVTDGARTALATAAHCPDALGFVDRDGTVTPLAMVDAWGAGRQDVQIHVAPAPLAPSFRADDADRPRVVTSWRNRESTRAGDFVCHRGERTGYSCADVEFVDYAPPGDLCAGPCPATWVAVQGPQCRSGDSGGPVFLGTLAFGLTKGGSYGADGGCRLYYYMSIDDLPPGWTVLHR